MHQPVIKNIFSKDVNITLQHSFTIPEKLEKQLKNYPKHYQPAGEKYAWKYLNSLVYIFIYFVC